MKKIKTAPYMPTEFKVEQTGTNKARVIAEPFETGFAISLAHPLRRFLLSSSIGYAPIALKVEGAKHEFDSIRGMLEDISEFILNLKAIRFKLKNDLESLEINFNFDGSREIYGRDLETDDLEIVTPDITLATLNEDANLNFTLIIYQGMGYVPSEDVKDELSSDFIPLDAYFTPVRSATYGIENVLVEDNPTFERISFNVETDGQIEPFDAFKNAVETMYAQMAVFNSEINISIPMASTTVVAEETPELKKMVHKIDELGLSARSYNCLDRSGIVYVGEIAIMSETELRDVKNLGKKSLDEIKDKIAEYGFDVSISLPSDLISAFKNKIEK